MKTSLDIFKKMNTAIFRRSWINTGLVDENEFNEEVDELEEYDVASSLLEKEEEEELIEHFLALQIEKDEAAAQMDVQEEAPFQIIEEKSSRAPPPKKQLKITSFFKNCIANLLKKIKFYRKTGIRLENIWMTSFGFFCQNRHKSGRHKSGKYVMKNKVFWQCHPSSTENFPVLCRF